MGQDIGAMGEGIRASQRFSRNMNHFQVEVGKVNKPSGLSMVESLGGMEISEVLVVSGDLTGNGDPWR